MSNAIQASYGTTTYSAPTKARETKQTGMQGSSFLDLAARASRNATDVLEINNTESTQQKTALSEAEEMQLFKKEFYEDLSKIVCNPTVSNAAVNISDAAFQAMKDDPEYRAQVLSLLQRDLGASFAPRNCSILITVGTDLDQYRADLLSASAAKSQLASMMRVGNLPAIFGDEIAGIPTETVLAITQAQVWGGAAIL